jgi:hypothetical protein
VAGCAAHVRLMTEAATTTETSVKFYQVTRRNNPEDINIHIILFSESIKERTCRSQFYREIRKTMPDGNCFEFLKSDRFTLRIILIPTYHNCSC